MMTAEKRFRTLGEVSPTPAVATSLAGDARETDIFLSGSPRLLPIAGV